MGLTEKTCIPCKGEGIAPLTTQEANDMLEHISDWELIDNATKIRRKFPFSNFVKSLAFVNKIGEIAEQQKHHPDICFGWGYCEVILQTHAIHGLHENDFIVAAKINQIAG